MRKNKLFAMALVAVMGVSVFAGCGKKAEEKPMTQQTEKPKEDNNKPAPAPQEADQGFEEIPIGEQQEVGPYIVSPVYFQAVDMYPSMGRNKEDAACHLEADIHLTAEKSVAFGFGDGEVDEEGHKIGAWPPYLTVKYMVIDEAGKTVTEGTFMPMNASDGPHYGDNIPKDKLSKAGKYKLKLEIIPPEHYMLHIDEETGVTGALKGSKEYEEFFRTYECEFDWEYEPVVQK